MIPRALEPRLVSAAKQFPVVTVLGPRQSGKTTLCRHAFPAKAYVSLESQDARRLAERDPRAFLAQFEEGAILDEVQRAPGIVSDLQEVVDRDLAPGRWILTGSENFALTASVAQSLAGRTAVLTLLPLSWGEILETRKPPRTLFEALLTGSYPRVHDARLAPGDWFDAYLSTYVERDVRQLLNVGDLSAFRTFLELCAGRSAQLLNLSSLGADAGVTHPTAKAWISVLEASYLVHRLPPFHANLTKRLVKSPKLHFLDSGLLCHLLDIREPDQLVKHPLRGAVFESWVVSEITKAWTHAGLRPRLSFYRDSSGVEVDVLVEGGPKARAVEVKSGTTLLDDLFAPLTRFESAAGKTAAAGRGKYEPVLVYAGDRSITIEGTRVVPWNRVHAVDWTPKGKWRLEG